MSNIEVSLNFSLHSVGKKLLNMLLDLVDLIWEFDSRCSRNPRSNNDHLGISVLDVEARQAESRVDLRRNFFRWLARHIVHHDN